MRARAPQPSTVREFFGQVLDPAVETVVGFLVFQAAMVRDPPKMLLCFASCLPLDGLSETRSGYQGVHKFAIKSVSDPLQRVELNREPQLCVFERCHPLLADTQPTG